MIPWVEAKRRHGLTDEQVQMARELGMNPKKLGGLDNHRQEPWKAPLPQFIEELYHKRFKRIHPDHVVRLDWATLGPRWHRPRVERDRPGTQGRAGFSWEEHPVVDRRKRLSANEAKAEPGREKAGKSTPLGTDPALTIPASQGAHLNLAYWHLWFALVATRDCGGELGRLAERLGQERSIVSIDRRSVERKRSHLRDLERRLTDAGMSVGDVVAAAGDLGPDRDPPRP